jgi:hypothetical protein
MSDKACHNMDSLPVTNKTAGEPESLMNKTLETGAAAVQVMNFSPDVVPSRLSQIELRACAEDLRASQCLPRICTRPHA